MDLIEVEFLIIGAGLSGVSLAMGLKKQNRTVCVVEQEPTPYDHFKGEYLQPLTIKILEEVGLGEAISEPDNVRIRGLRFRDLGPENKSIRSETKVNYPWATAALAMPNLRLVKNLRNVLRKTLGANFFEGATIKPENSADKDFCDHPLFILKDQSGKMYRVRPAVVIGCDGKQSKTRQWIKGPRPIKNGHTVLGAQPEFIVGCEATGVETTPGQYEVIRSHDSGTISIFSLGGGLSRVYWNAPANLLTAPKGVPLKDLWAEHIEKVFAEMYPVTGLKLGNPLRVSGAPAYTAWYGPGWKGRVFLAGDSLAVTTPFGGQGMTCGSLHVRTLLDAFAKTPTLTVGAIAKVGRDYERRAHDTFAHFNLVNIGLYYLFFSRAPIFKGAAAHVTGAWKQNPALAARVGRLFGGADLDTPLLRELLQLWGIPLPKLMPTKISAALIKPHVILDRLTRWTDTINAPVKEKRGLRFHLPRVKVGV